MAGIKTIGVCGAGVMGSQLAAFFASAGFETLLFDLNQELSEKGLQGALKETFGIEPPLSDLRAMGRDEMSRRVGELARGHYEEREKLIGSERALFHQRMIMLQIVDTQWKDHLYSLDHLKEGLASGPGGGGASAVLAASIFHFGTYTVPQAKRYLSKLGILVRPIDE